MKIKNLEKKLNGELPVTREELIELIDSWGRTDGGRGAIEAGECYDLSKLDTSQITNFDNLFECSLFDGDVSNWDTTNVTSMKHMAYKAINFNSPLPWNTPNLKSIDGTFCYAENFNQPLNWNTSNVTNASAMLWWANSFEHPIIFDVSNLREYDLMLDGSAFLKKFNNGERMESPKQWIKDNRDRMKELIITDTLENNQKTFNDLIKEKSIVVGSPMYNSLLELYNETQEELKSYMEELRNDDMEELIEGLRKETVETNTMELDYMR